MSKFRKPLLALVLSLCLLSVNSYAQERKNVIKVNPIALALGGFNATYEMVLNSHSSMLFSGSYAFNLLGEDVSVAGLGVGYRYYFTHKKTEIPSGFWLTPQVGFETGSLKDGSNKESVYAFALGAQIGYQWAWKNGFTLDIGIGPSYANMSGAASASGIIPMGTLAVGFAF